jgi:hypothetical protein
MERNKYDKDKCLERGVSAEEKFFCVANNQGWIVEPSTAEQDMNEHWDYKLTKNGQSFKVDVKAMKKIKRTELSVQDEWVWLELHGVRQSDDGWLYDGKSDLIAFEKNHSFFLVKRSELIDFLPSIINMNSLVTNVEEAKYKIYQRMGRPDKITLVELQRLEPIKFDEWLK